jgi:hypothetical protein
MLLLPNSLILYRAMMLQSTKHSSWERLAVCVCTRQGFEMDDKESLRLGYLWFVFLYKKEPIGKKMIYLLIVVIK